MTGATSPEAISRSEASPEAETTSYSPVFIRVTASSEVPKYFTLAWQPVFFSNGVTQSTFGSLRAVLGVARPGEDVDLALHRAERLLHRDVRRG